MKKANNKHAHNNVGGIQMQTDEDNYSQNFDDGLDLQNYGVEDALGDGMDDDTNGLQDELDGINEHEVNLDGPVRTRDGQQRGRYQGESNLFNA